jgi:hypothetical protein
MGGDCIVLALCDSRIAPSSLSCCGAESILSQGEQTDIPVILVAILTESVESPLDGARSSDCDPKACRRLSLRIACCTRALPIHK